MLPAAHLLLSSPVLHPCCYTGGQGALVPAASPCLQCTPCSGVPPWKQLIAAAGRSTLLSACPNPKYAHTCCPAGELHTCAGSCRVSLGPLSCRPACSFGPAPDCCICLRTPTLCSAGKLLAFSGPSAVPRVFYGYKSFVPEDYDAYFKKRGVSVCITSLPASGGLPDRCSTPCCMPYSWQPVNTKWESSGLCCGRSLGMRSLFDVAAESTVGHCGCHV